VQNFSLVVDSNLGISKILAGNFFDGIEGAL
jgi:hypothetical protein